MSLSSDNNYLPDDFIKFNHVLVLYLFTFAEKYGTKAFDGMLEDFNVRVFYDKLEDQNLHLAAQLARQKEDNQAFYNNMIEQVKGLRELLLNMDPDKLEELDRKLEEREKRLTRNGMQGAGTDSGPNIINANVTIGGSGQHKFSGEYIKALK